MTRSAWAEILPRAAHRWIPTEAGFPGSRRVRTCFCGFAFGDSGRDRWYPVSGPSGYAGPAGDLTREGTDASDSAAPCGWNGPTLHAPEPPLLLSTERASPPSRYRRRVLTPPRARADCAPASRACTTAGRIPGTSRSKPLSRRSRGFFAGIPPIYSASSGSERQESTYEPAPMTAMLLARRRLARFARNDMRRNRQRLGGRLPRAGWTILLIHRRSFVPGGTQVVSCPCPQG
jgi:hypothetical protein